jgi:hypothetical protein
MAGGPPVRPLARLSLVAALVAALCAFAGAPGIHAHTTVSHALQVSLLPGGTEPGMSAAGSQAARVIRHRSPAAYPATPTRDLRGVAQPSCAPPAGAAGVSASPLAWAALPLEHGSQRTPRVVGVPTGRAPPVSAGL